MKFKVLLRKRGGARAFAAGRELFLEIRPFDGSCAFYVYLSCFMTRHAVPVVRGGSWWSCQLIDPSGWGVGAWLGMQVRQSARPLTWCCRCIR